MKILLSGYNGDMGRMVETLSDSIVAGYARDIHSAPYSTYTKLDEVQETFDVILDFSHPSCLKDILNYAVSVKKPLVTGTTGFELGHHQMIDLASSHIAIVQSDNFSAGVNALVDISALLTKMLKDYDIEIIEKHHNKKVDAPSGTAKMLAEIIMEKSETIDTLSHGRVGSDVQRKVNELGIHSVRGGTIVGEHSVLFAGDDEVIEIKHSAYSKKIFAKGSLDACEYIIKRKPGRYSMKDVINHD